MVNPDEIGHAKTLNHRENKLRKTQ